jgi:predicted permease
MPRWWTGRRSDRDFREEIDAHLALEADRQAAERGLAPADARLAAHRTFGNVTHAQERFFRSQRWAWAERLRQHVRYAVRAIRLSPGFSLAAILTLGVGIGFNTAVFTVFYALGFRALPVRDADRLVNIYQVFHGTYSRGVHGTEAMVSYPEYQAYQSSINATRGGGGALEEAAVYADVDLAFASSRSGAIHGEYVSCNYFSTLGVRLAAGRGFVADECARPGDPAVAVLSHATWMRDFDGDTSVVGRIVRINSMPFTVIGVAEADFSGLWLQSAGVWVPVTMQMAVDRGQGRDSLLTRDWSWMVMVARLAPGARVESARAQLVVAARQRDQLYPGRETSVVVATGALLNFPEARQRGLLVVVLLSVLGALVVAMVSANIMNLLLARGVARRREIGIRLALGASRGRLIEQLLTESAVLAIAGGALGFALAHTVLGVVPSLIPVPGLQVDLSLDGRVFTFTLIVSLITALTFGLVPALQATRIDLHSAAKGGLSASWKQMRPSRLRACVVGVQVAGSALLLIIAALFVRAAMRGASIDPGYATNGVVSFELNLPLLGYSADRSMYAYATLRDRLAATPGVHSVAFASPLPLLGRRSDSVDPDDGTSTRGTVDEVSMVNASGTYLATMQIPLVAGRSYTDAEVRLAGDDQQPVVVSQSLATALWQAQPALGKRIRMAQRHFVVVGVAANTRPVSLSDATTPFMYLPGVPGRDRNLRVVARTSGPTAQLERLVPQWAHELDPAIVVTTQRMSERVDLALMPARLSSAVAGTMGALTLVLAVIGIYGVVSYSVAQRTKEIAVRLALGATQRGVVRLMMRQGSRAVIIGLIAGTVAALGVSRVIASVLFGVSPLDPVAYAATAGVLLGASLVATYAPARRAARVNPASTLRED